MLEDRFPQFDLESAVILTVLHCLFDPESDRAAEKWRRDCRIEGRDALELHHLDRAMAWLGRELGESGQQGGTPFST